jgi:methionine salvage enolase-phosphatase E1
VQAQLQFFSYVRDGPNTTRDIKPLFSAHYDTVNAGPKMEKQSYEKICTELGKSVDKVAFLTDNVKGMWCSLAIVALDYLKQHTTRFLTAPVVHFHPTLCLASFYNTLPTYQPTLHHHNLTFTYTTHLFLHSSCRISSFLI